MFCIVGADGFFGGYIQRLLLSRQEEVLAFNHRQPVFPSHPLVKNCPFELADKESLDAAEKLLRQYRDIKIIYLAAAHNPDFVKADPAGAMRINRELYSEFLKKISLCDITELWYSSSDTVYGESTGGTVFTEDMPLSPINVYGEQKAEAERVTLENGFSVARFSYMFAPSLSAKRHFFDKITDDLRAGKEIVMFSDYVRSSLDYPTAAEYLVRLINTKTDKKIVNICADNPTSKYDIGLIAAEYCGADRALVVPALSDSTGVFTEKRAKELVMSNKLLRSIVNETGVIKAGNNFHRQFPEE